MMARMVCGRIHFGPVLHSVCLTCGSRLLAPEFITYLRINAQAKDIIATAQLTASAAKRKAK